MSRKSNLDQFAKPLPAEDGPDPWEGVNLEDLEDEAPEGGKGKKPKASSLATDALRLAIEAGAEPWLDDAGMPHITLPRAGHLEHYRLKPDTETPAARWLAAKFYMAKGKALSASAKKDALENLIAEAISTEKTHPTARRVTRLDGKVFLDLGGPSWEVVEITPGGWKVRPASEVPVRFTRAAGMKALPRPVTGGDLRQLRPFFHCEEDDFRLICVWTLAALSAGREYPVLVLQGEAGSSKSSATALARALVDPNKAPLRKVPKEERDLFVAANNAFVLTMDNLSTPPDWLPDALCALALDTGYACRALYTDDEEAIFQVASPCILNGITDQLTRSDLADRAFCVTLQRVPPEKMRPKDELYADFEAALPRILGAFLTILAAALKNLPAVKLDRLPRMAQTAKLAAAAEPALGWEPGTFARLFHLAQESVAATATEGDPMARALDIIASRGAGYWTFEGTATELQETLKGVRLDPQPLVWPPAPNKVGERIRRLAPQLRLMGWNVNPEKRDGSKRNRKLIQLESPLSAASRTVSDGSSDGTESNGGAGSDGIGRSDGSSRKLSHNSPLPEAV